MTPLLQVASVAFRLGLTSFGGPVAHLAYFRNAYVGRGWVSEAEYLQIVALAQALPGPTSSQVGIAIGYRRAGVWGALVAWLGFTLPSALFLTWLALGVASLGPVADAWLRGLGWVAVAVVAHAVVTMGLQNLKSVPRAAWAVVTALVAGCLPSWTIPLVLVAAAVSGGARVEGPVSRTRLPQATLWAWGGFLAVGLVMFFARWLWPVPALVLADGLYRTGALVFGGGHVVLPLLQSEVAAPLGIPATSFLAGYAWAQAIPGPLFSVAAYLGAVVAGPWGAAVALVAIFLPSFFLVLGTLPWWLQAAEHPRWKGALGLVNAAVVGLLASAWVHPVLTSGVHNVVDAVAAAALLVALFGGVAPVWTVAAALVASTVLLLF